MSIVLSVCGTFITKILRTQCPPCPPGLKYLVINVPRTLNTRTGCPMDNQSQWKLSMPEIYLTFSQSGHFPLVYIVLWILSPRVKCPRIFASGDYSPTDIHIQETLSYRHLHLGGNMSWRHSPLVKIVQGHSYLGVIVLGTFISRDYCPTDIRLSGVKCRGDTHLW